MKVKEFSDYAYPRRKPWWLLVLLAVVLAFFLYRRERGQKTVETEGTVATAASVPAGDRPDSARPAQATPVTPVRAPADVQRLLTDASAREGQGDLLRARELYLQAWNAAGDTPVRGSIEPRLGKINIELLMNPYAMPEKEEYTVRPGDSVARIAKRYGTTRELVARSNRLQNENIIKAGDRMRIFTGKFAVHVSKTKNEVVLRMNDQFFKRYTVGTGRFGKTPVGTFEVDDRIANPDWWTDGRRIPYGNAENILGTHWLSIRATGETPQAAGYGLHGTWDNTSLGKASSAGCVRMRNEEVEEIFVLLPLGTPVVIAE